MKRLVTGERVWHVFARGARRLALFYEDFDYLTFLSILHEACFVSGCILHAYCLMGNHYHLILRATSAQLSRCMWLLNRKYALHHNRRHKMGGHVFDGPYKAYRQRTVHSIFWRIAYVFLNPVMAGWVDRPEHYRWSGFLSFMGLEGSPLAVSMPGEMSFLGGDLAASRAGFLRVLEEQRRKGKKSSRSPRGLDIQAEQFEWLLRRAEEQKASFPAEDPQEVALYWGRQCGIPPRAMASVLGETDATKVRDRISKLAKRIRGNPDRARALELP
jgi:REP element-mobilizing transposase RayT